VITEWLAQNLFLLFCFFFLNQKRKLRMNNLLSVVKLKCQKEFSDRLSEFSFNDLTNGAYSLNVLFKHDFLNTLKSIEEQDYHGKRMASFLFSPFADMKAKAESYCKDHCLSFQSNALSDFNDLDYM
jgi:hypothetical protein